MPINAHDSFPPRCIQLCKIVRARCIIIFNPRGWSSDNENKEKATVNKRSSHLLFSNDRRSYKFSSNFFSNS